MKKGIIVLGLLVGTAFIVSANGNGRDNSERQRQNDDRNYQYQTNETGERQRLNVVDPNDCTLDEVGTGYLNEDGRKNQGRNRK